MAVLATASLSTACPDPVSDAPDSGLLDSGPLDAAPVDAYIPSFRDCACGTDAPETPDANLDASMQEDAYTEPDAYSAPDAPMVDASSAPVDAYSPDAFPVPDAGTPACDPPAPLGATSGGLTLEGCTLVGLPGGFAGPPPFGSDNGIHGVTVGNDGRVWVTFGLGGLSGDRIAAFTPEPGPSCTLRYAPITLSGIRPGALDVAADGTLYVTSSGSGARSAHWQGPRSGACLSAPALGAMDSGLDAMEDGRLLFPTWSVGMNTSAVVLDTRTCAFSYLPLASTDRTRYAARLGDDIAVDGDDDGCGLQRVDGTTLTREFCGPAGMGIPQDAARCGEDVCVFASSPTQIRRYSGVDGREVADLAGVTAPLPSAFGAFDMDGSPDGRTLVFAATSRCASGPYGLLIWRLTGF